MQKPVNFILTTSTCKMLSGNLVIADQTVQFHQVKASGLDGDIMLEGSYSTLESRESPEIALTYDVKGLGYSKNIFCF